MAPSQIAVKASQKMVGLALNSSVGFGVFYYLVLLKKIGDSSNRKVQWMM